MAKQRKGLAGYRSCRPLPDSARPTSDSYRPLPREDHTSRPRQDRPGRDSYDSWRPSDDGGRDSRKERNRNSVPQLPPFRSAVAKTKHERKSNPSTRIHSLKRQLQTEQLPGLIRQERERELASLLLEQQKAQIAQESRKNLERYHFVRFLERKKAERNFKQLNQRKTSPNYQSESQQSELDKLMHIAEVDINYTKYVPLGDKYISLFPQDEKDKKRDKMQINRTEFDVLDKEQQEEVRKLNDQLSNIIRTATGSKPPMWYEVEKAMEQGQAQLEALRDGKLTSGKQLKKDLAALGGKEDAAMRTANGQPLEEAKPEWLDDDGVIDPADLDSDQDEAMSDGGFFER